MKPTTAFRRAVLALAAAPLALGLSACGKGGEGADGANAKQIAPIAAPAGKAWADMVTKTADGGYLVGNPEAPIKLMEFAALSCSHCADFSRASSAELRDTFIASGRVSYELRLFMLNALDMPGALLVTCGAPETVPTLAEQFWAWQPTMFENLQKAPEAQMQAIENLQPPRRLAALAQVTGMDAFVNARGISADQANACLADSNKVTEIVRQNEAWSKEFNITGTPTFVVNGEKASINTWPEVKARLQAMGAR